MNKLLESLDDFDENSQALIKNILNSNNLIDPDSLQKGILGTGKDPFEGIRTGKTFDEISNEYALNTPFGKKVHFINLPSKTMILYPKTFILGELIIIF